MRRSSAFVSFSFSFFAMIVTIRVSLCAIIGIFAATAAAAGLLGTTLYTRSDLDRAKWTYDEQIDLRCRMAAESLVPGRVPANGADAFLGYFDLLRDVTNTKFGSESGRKRAMVAVTDAIGGYMYAKLLPRARRSYYEARLDYPTAKRLHDLMANIKYALNTDGRGWARPVAPPPTEPTGRDKPVAVPPREVDAAADKRCGGVDGGPYGLAQWTAAGLGVVPYFDDGTRPRSLVVPWRPGRLVLYSVDDAGCHRALYDHCVRAAGNVSGRGARAALRQWMDRAVGPLVGPAESAAGRWYPALWGASLVCRRLGPADVGKATAQIVAVAPPNFNFYAAVVLVSMSVLWTSALIAWHYDTCPKVLCEVLARALCSVQMDEQ